MEFYDYLMLLRWGCLGNFKKLVTKMVVDNCMLEYIDNDQNFVNNPNENYARELFEHLEHSQSAFALLDLPHRLFEACNIKRDCASLIFAFASTGSVCTFGVGCRKTHDLKEMKIVSGISELRNFFYLKQCDLLRTKAQLKTDLHDRRVLLRIPVFANDLKQVMLLIGSWYTCLTGFRHRTYEEG